MGDLTPLFWKNGQSEVVKDSDYPIPDPSGRPVLAVFRRSFLGNSATVPDCSPGALVLRITGLFSAVLAKVPDQGLVSGFVESHQR